MCRITETKVQSQETPVAVLPGRNQVFFAVLAKGLANFVALFCVSSVHAQEIRPFGPLEYGQTISEVRNIICVEQAIDGMTEVHDLCADEDETGLYRLRLYPQYRNIPEDPISRSDFWDMIKYRKADDLGYLAGELPIRGGQTEFFVGYVYLFGMPFELHLRFDTLSEILAYQALEGSDKYCFARFQSGERFCEYPVVLERVRLISYDKTSLLINDEIKNAFEQKYKDNDSVEFDSRWDAQVPMGDGYYFYPSKIKATDGSMLTIDNGDGKGLRIDYEGMRYLFKKYGGYLDEYAQAKKSEAMTGGDLQSEL